MSSKFTFIDLCAGIGGLRLPFDANKGGLPGECVFTAEIDKHAKLTYARNFKKPTQTVEEAIAEISDDINELDLAEVPRHDLLLAGFPCQPFSHAGKRQGFNDDRGNVFEGIRKIIAAKRPKVVLLENVRGLMTLKNLDGSKAIDRVVLDLENPAPGLSYVVPKPRALNARDFGLPQNRIRLFIIAVRSDVAESKSLQGPDGFEWPLPTSNRDELSLEKLLAKEAPPEFTISDRLWEGHKVRKARNVQNGKGWGYQLFTRQDKYVATISARYFKDGSEALIFQDSGRNPRKLTPDEARALQGFPENFKIHESKMQAFRQFGNAVPVNVIRSLAKSLEKYLY